MPKNLRVNYKVLKEEYLRTGKLVATCKKYKVSPAALSRRLKEDGVEVKLSAPVSLKYLCNSEYFSDINTEEKAYWLGFCFAECWVEKTTDKRRSSSVSGLRFGIELSMTDHEHLRKLKKALNSKAPIGKRVRHGKTKKIRTCSLRIGDPVLCKSLSTFFPIGKKAGVLVFPKLPQELIAPFIRGFFDGDGCITSNGYVSIRSNSLGFLKRIKQIFVSIGVGSSSKDIHKEVVIHKNRVYTSYKYTKCKDAPRILSWLYSNSTTHLSRKYCHWLRLSQLAVSSSNA